MKLAKEKMGYLEGWVAIVVTAAMFVLKFIAGRKIGSVSMVADAWHTLSDTITSVVVIVGAWIMSRPADKQHPYGHARAENIAAIVIGVLLAVVGVYFGYESVMRLLQHKAVTFSLGALLVFSVSVVFQEGLAQFAFWLGRLSGSKSITADGWHHRSDAIASALIVIGALVGGKLWWMDGALGIGVALLIIWAAIGIIRDTSSVLMGEELDEETRTAILESVRRECPEVVDDVHHLHVHRYGGTVALTLHIRVPAAMSVKESHAITDRIEDRLKRELKLDATVHPEPLPG